MFELPELDGLGATELDALLAAVRDEAATIISAVNDPATSAGADLDRLAALSGYVTAINTASEAVATALAARIALAADLTAQFAVADPEPEVAEEAPPVAVEPVVAAAPLEGKIVAHPKARAVVAAAPKVEAPADTREVAIVAAAGVAGMRGGQIATLADFVKPAVAKWGSYAGMTHGLVQDELFSLKAPERDPRLVATGANDQNVMTYAADQYRLKNPTTGETGVIAAGGWCAPAEQRFDICTLAEVDGILDVPTISMPRGSISYFRQLDYSTVNTALNASGLFTYTNAQLVVTPATVKPCFEIPCATPVTATLDARGLCLRAGILQQKAFPELIAAWLDLALIAYAHFLNALNIAEIVAGSGAAIVTPSTFGVIAQVYEAVALQSTVYRAQNGMAANATLEVVFPYWLPALMQVDHERRQFNNEGSFDFAADLAELNVRAQYVKDYQMTAFIAADPVTLWPTTVNFLLFAPGAWVRGAEDIISVSTLYDSTLLQTNRVQLLFVEAGTKMLPWCGPSKQVTVSICASGATGGPIASTPGALTCGQ